MDWSMRQKSPWRGTFQRCYFFQAKSKKASPQKGYTAKRLHPKNGIIWHGLIHAPKGSMDLFWRGTFQRGYFFQAKSKRASPQKGYTPRRLYPPYVLINFQKFRSLLIVIAFLGWSLLELSLKEVASLECTHGIPPAWESITDMSQMSLRLTPRNRLAKSDTVRLFAFFCWKLEAFW